MSKDATRGSVRDYLVKYYGVTQTEADSLVAKHSEIVDDAIAVRSYTYYPADKIAAAEGLNELELEEDDDDEEDR